jgi:hypothetical protein
MRLLGTIRLAVFDRLILGTNADFRGKIKLCYVGHEMGVFGGLRVVT